MAVLNFSDAELGRIKKFLSRFPALETKSMHESLRCKIQHSTITLYKTGKLLVQGADSEDVKNFLLEKLQFGSELVLGIDEAGRGEAYGPFTIAAVLGSADMLRELRDSKKTRNLQEKQKLVEKSSNGVLVHVIGAEEIDRLRSKGKTMNEIEADAIDDLVKAFRSAGFSGKVLVDGSRLPVKTRGIEFIVHGDDKNAVIGAASIVAKNARDSSAKQERRKTWKLKH